MSRRLIQIASTHMPIRLSRRAIRQFAFSIPLLFSSIAVLAQVDFPSNPQTRAECEGPAAQMRAMEARESAARRQKYKEVEAMQYESESAKYNTLEALMAEQGKEAGRIRDQLNELEKTCRTAAAKNEQLAKDEVQRVLEAFQALKDSYDEAKKAYDIAKDLYLKPPAELAEDAVNRAADRLADATVAAAHARRNNAYSAALENVLNDAKRKILDLIPKSRIVTAIQNASFDQLKSHAQQILGDWNQLESDIRSVQASLSRPVAPSADVSESRPVAPSADVSETVPLSRRGGTSGAAMFQQAIDQAEQEERDRPMREARERARLAKVAEDEARVRRETLARLERERPQPAPIPTPAPRAPSSVGSGVCDGERQAARGGSEDVGNAITVDGLERAVFNMTRYMMFHPNMGRDRNLTVYRTNPDVATNATALKDVVINYGHQIRSSPKDAAANVYYRCLVLVQIGRLEGRR